MVTDEVLEEFKARMHITHKSEDGNLRNLLSFSIVAIKRDCGHFDINGEKDTEIQAKELVFERTRYAYNDAVEYFDENFKSEIFSLGIELAGEENAEV
jgi:hypothetical protein